MADKTEHTGYTTETRLAVLSLQLDNLMEKLNRIEDQRDEDIHDLKQELKNLKEKEIKEIKEDISEIHTMANKWKGGFIVVMGIGGFVGWIMSTFGSFFSKVAG